MILKNDSEQFQSYLSDASNFPGTSSELFIPENEDELIELTKICNLEHKRIVISGNGTGVTGARVPQGEAIVSLEKLNSIIELNTEEKWIRIQPAIILKDFQEFAESNNLFYPPDPTERNCFVGGTVATNASGARSFKYGPTRNYVIGLRIILPTGEILKLDRGQYLALKNEIRFNTNKNERVLQIPNYKAPQTKNASGYYCKPHMDLIDLFIGSEGTLGIITEIKLALIDLPGQLLSCVVFFTDELNALDFIDEARKQSKNVFNSLPKIDARGLEFFDVRSLKFLEKDFPGIPSNAKCAVWFEQEIVDDTTVELWLDLITKHSGDPDTAWIATNAADLEKFKNFRHSISWKVNEYITQNKFRKVGTDTAVPLDHFRDYYFFMKNLVESNNIDYVVYGHFGDCHPHLNMLPKNSSEFTLAKNLYSLICLKAIEYGGTISAEHGVGKIKKDYLLMMYGEKTIREMAHIKLFFDPNKILSIGNIFEEKFLE